MSPRDVVVRRDSRSISSTEPHELEATTDMCHYCFDVLVKELTAPHLGRRGLERSESSFAETVPTSVECPLFVTWDKRHRKEFVLRGCIGTLSPRPLHSSIREYALTSALRDRRFDPIRVHEIPYLRVGVSLLVKYEECSHCHDWTVGMHGIIIRFSLAGVEYSATYLPEVAEEQGWTQQEAIRSLIRKTGYRGMVEDRLLRRIRCTRYQSSKQRVSYQEYVDTVGGDPLRTQHVQHASPSCIIL